MRRGNELEAPEALGNLISLLQRREQVKICYDLAEQMLQSTDLDQDAFCRYATFGREYGQFLQIDAIPDQELILELLQTVKKYYAERLGNIDLLVGLAEKAVSKACGKSLPELLKQVTNRK